MFKFWRAAAEEPNIQDWCKSTWPMVYRFTYGYVQNREEAEDITQETYSRALKNLSSKDELPTNAYLKTVAMNLIRDRWRRMKSGGTQVPLEDYMLITDSMTDSIDTRELIQKLMSQLPDDYQRVLLLRIIQGYSRSETAKLMERSEDSIRGLQFRALQQLKSLTDQNDKEVDTP